MRRLPLTLAFVAVVIYGVHSTHMFKVLAAPGSEPGMLLITNQGSGTLAVLDEPSLGVKRVIPIGERPWGVAVSVDRKSACVAFTAGLAVVDLDNGAVERRVLLDARGWAWRCPATAPSAMWRSAALVVTDSLR